MSSTHLRVRPDVHGRPPEDAAESEAEHRATDALDRDGSGAVQKVHDESMSSARKGLRVLGLVICASLMGMGIATALGSASEIRASSAQPQVAGGAAGAQDPTADAGLLLGIEPQGANNAVGRPESTADAARTELLMQFGCQGIVESARDTPADRFTRMVAVCPGSANMNTEALVRDPDGNPVATMTAKSCGYNALAGASVTTGVLAEFGTWCGGSMRCIVRGVNSTGLAGRAYGFDIFRAGCCSDMPKLKRFTDGTRWAEKVKKFGEEFNSVKMFYWYTRTLYPSTVAVEVHDLHKNGRSALMDSIGDYYLDVWATDAAKTWQHLESELLAVSSRLRPGSIVIMGDLFLSPAGGQYDLIIEVYSQLVRTGTLELLAVVDNESYAFFGVRDKISIVPSSGHSSEFLEELRLEVESDVRRVARISNTVHIEQKIERINRIFSFHIRASENNKWPFRWPFR